MDDVQYVPLFWSVVAVEHSGVYSNQPVPDVRPRNEANDPTYRSVAKCIQRALSYCIDQDSFDDTMHRTVDDYLGYALGWPRVKVDSIIETDTSSVPIYAQDPMTGQYIQTGEEESTFETVGDQSVNWAYVAWSQFGWEPCNSWKDCDWIYIKHPMTKSQARERFGKDVNGSKKSDSGHTRDESWVKGTIDIYEIWDKDKREVLFIAEGEDYPLEINPDPLSLIGFFPGPRPMMMNVPSEELIPKSDYDFIEPYDMELNRLQERRMALLEMIKAHGAYDAGMPELGEMLNNDDGKFTPVANLMARANAAGGVENILLFLPLQEKTQVLATLTEQIGFVKANVDEIQGISDIVRGVTAASESATAQEIKGRWVGVRLTRKRECVQYTIREMLRITSQLLASHITPENLARMTQMEMTPQMQEILHNDMLMEFSIDIEIDSTIAKDVAMERETHQEMLNGIAQYSQSVLPMVQANVMPATTASALLRAALRPYTKYDRDLEESLAQMPDTMAQLKQLTDASAQKDQQIEQQTQQLQQAQQETQQWKSAAETLQQQATQASSQQKISDSKLKDAQAVQIMAKIPDDKIQPLKSAAEVGLIEAQTMDTLRPDPMRTN